MRLLNNFTMKCNECGTTHLFKPADSRFAVLESGLIGASIETLYEWKRMFACECGETIAFTYLVWEYPQGCFDTEEIEVDGADVRRRFSFRFGDARSAGPGLQQDTDGSAQVRASGRS